MEMDFFASSDSLRGAVPLRHVQRVAFERELRLESGGCLPAVVVAYETYGKLNAARDNAVLICHALSGDSHVAKHDEEDVAGWWDIVVGPGQAIDTNRYFVICPNILGGCRGTTGPNTINPLTSRPYGGDFPAITVGDMVEVQRWLVDHLGIDKLLAVVGGSLGGHQALTWATRYPQRMAGTIAIATSPCLTSQALAFDVVGRNAILRDPHFHHGQYYDKREVPAVGLALARMLGHITYLSREAMIQKFDVARLQARNVPTEFEKKFSVGSYLAYQGHKFVERFDANSYVTLTMAMDLFDLSAGAPPENPPELPPKRGTPGQGQAEEEEAPCPLPGVSGGGPQSADEVRAGENRKSKFENSSPLQAALGQAQCQWLVLSFSSDWLFPPFQSRQIVEALIAENKPVTYLNITSDCGHDAFLLEDNLAIYGRMMGAFLSHLDGHAAPLAGGEAVAAGTSQAADPTSIFHAQRLDYARLLDLIPLGASVLDVGCGDGAFLALLKQRGHERLVGVELDEREILACAARGLQVVHGDLNQGLGAFRPGQFDVVVLSQTLQSIVDTERIMREIVRVGRRAIVSFPNFAYEPLRHMLAREGRSPRAPGLYGYEWYNTPNRRFPSIADFEAFCQVKRLTIHRRVALNTAQGREVNDDPNLRADLAIFVISM